jgi:hypothetical protein
MHFVGERNLMDTYYAPAERLKDEELAREIDFISNNTIIDGLLRSVSGLLAVLNEHRQILSVNSLLMRMLNIDNFEDILGLRPGEALRCVHAHRMEGGCGTSQYCSTCGAAISIVTSLATDAPVERKCALTVNNGNARSDLFFNVRCVPVTYESRRMLLLFMQDTTHYQSLLSMEKIFFHDINNILTSLVNASQLLGLTSDDDKKNKLSQTVSRLSLRLANEMSAQRCLCQYNTEDYSPTLTVITSYDIMSEIKDIFFNPLLKKYNQLICYDDIYNVPLLTEPSLLIRVLSNMIINALEETPEGESAKIWTSICDNVITFSVWNSKAIDSSIAMRIFQRNFTTKSGPGRGLGTYSMKLFGEDILGGKVGFTSSEEDGTVFRFSLDIHKGGLRP